MESKVPTLTPIDFSISPFQTYVVFVITEAFYTLKCRDKDKFYTVEEFYELFNKRALVPYELGVHHFKDVISKMEVYGFLHHRIIKGKSAYRIGELKVDSLIND